MLKSSGAKQIQIQYLITRSFANSRTLYAIREALPGSAPRIYALSGESLLLIVAYSQ